MHFLFDELIFFEVKWWLLFLHSLEVQITIGLTFGSLCKCYKQKPDKTNVFTLCNLFKSSELVRVGLRTNLTKTIWNAWLSKQKKIMNLFAFVDIFESKNLPMNA